MAKRQSPEATSGSTKPPEAPLSLPTITHLQFLVLDLLSTENSPVSAYRLKQGAARLANDYDGPKFYQLMGRLIRDQLVIAETKAINTDGGSMERTFYTPTQQGLQALHRTRIFYTTRHRLQAALSGE
jgi:DNA-binding PadR family transcriptional regulator